LLKLAAAYAVLEMKFFLVTTWAKEEKLRISYHGIAAASSEGASFQGSYAVLYSALNMLFAPLGGTCALGGSKRKRRFPYLA